MSYKLNGVGFVNYVGENANNLHNNCSIRSHVPKINKNVRGMSNMYNMQKTTKTIFHII